MDYPEDRSDKCMTCNQHNATDVTEPTEIYSIFVEMVPIFGYSVEHQNRIIMHLIVLYKYCSEVIENRPSFIFPSFFCAPQPLYVGFEIAYS